MSQGERSVFDERQIEDIYKEIREVYLGDKRPWVIGYSGGKDSTCTLQLVWHAMRGMPKEQLSKPIYVIASDTLVETPVIVNYIDATLERVDSAAQREGLPFRAQKVRPALRDSFWVNLVGKGYPAPSSRFRWCTERLKIKPANRFILDKVAEHGEVVMVLGVRKAESATRQQVMSLHKLKGRRLSRHSSLPNAYVYTPVEDFSTNDIWSYLLQVSSPWGNENRDLLALYRNAQAGECPLVIDKTTPSCGNSRFGCWVCTVVEQDKTMQSLVDSGEEWLQPLLDFRTYLTDTQDPERKQELRDYRRRDGKLWRTREGNIARGPYKLDVCREILRRILEIQQQVRREGPNPRMIVISPEDLFEIRRLWRAERQDWEDSVPTIYREVTGEDLGWVRDDTAEYGAKEKQLLEEVCGQYGLPTAMMAKLLDVETQFSGMARRSAIYRRIDGVLNEEWRSEENVKDLIEELAELGDME